MRLSQPGTQRGLVRWSWRVFLFVEIQFFSNQARRGGSASPPQLEVWTPPRPRCVPQGHVFDKSDDNSWICWLYFFGSSQNRMRFCTGVSSGPPHVRHLSLHKVVSCLAFCKKWNKNRFFNSTGCNWSFIAFSFLFFLHHRGQFINYKDLVFQWNNTITDLILGA